MTPNILPKTPRPKTDAATERLWKLVKFTILFSFPKACFFLVFCLLLSSLTCLFVCFFFSPRLIFCNFLSFLLLYTFYLLPFHSGLFFVFFYTTFSLLRVSDSLILYIKRTAQHRFLLASLSITAQNFYKPKITARPALPLFFPLLFCSISISLHV